MNMLVLLAIIYKVKCAYLYKDGGYCSRAIRKSNCFHKRGHGAPCKFSNNKYMIGLGITEILVSQIPNFHKLSWLSIVAAIMSFAYSSIGLGLAFTKVISGTFPLFLQVSSPCF